MASIALFTMALGKHLFSTRLHDVQLAIDYLLSQPQYKRARLVVWGSGPREGLMALYLAAVDSRVQAVISSYGLLNYGQVVETPGLVDFDYYIPGLLKYADTPQIVAAIAPRPVVISSPVTTQDVVVDRESAAIAFQRAVDFYALVGNPQGLSLTSESELPIAAVRLALPKGHATGKR
jgi:hypothetical protein